MVYEPLDKRDGHSERLIYIVPSLLEVCLIGSLDQLYSSGSSCFYHLTLTLTFQRHFNPLSSLQAFVLFVSCFLCANSVFEIATRCFFISV